jgi:hypothetical protein
MSWIGHQQQWPALGVSVEEFAYLAQHPVQVYTDELPQQGFALFSSTQPGQLQQPGWGNGTQQSRQVRIRATQLRQSFEYRVVWLAASVVLHAMTARTSNVAEPGNKTID